MYQTLIWQQIRPVGIIGDEILERRELAAADVILAAY